MSQEDASLEERLRMCRQAFLRLRSLVGNPGTCRSCGAEGYWVTTKSKGPRTSGKPMLIDPDGTSHFATCPNAEQHRRRRRSAG